MMREGEAIGCIVLRKPEPGLLAPHQVQLLETFAAQAVIAIENVRLFTELRQRTDDLQESLEYQTATSEVLEVISRSAFDLKAVLHTLVETATRLCEADKATITRLRDGVFYREESYGFSPEFADYVRELPITPGRDTGTALALLERRPVHIADVEADPDFAFEEGRRLDPFRTVLAVPMLRDGTAIGAIALTRSEVRPFSDKQVEMLSTFADQAVIALENARLLSEQREALEQQTATAEVLAVINTSPGNLAPVFDAILEKAHNLCDAPCGSLQLYDGSMFRAVADRGLPEELATLLRQGQVPRQSNPSHHEVTQVADIVEIFGELPDDPVMRAVVKTARLRTMLWVPLIREGAYLGRIVAARRDVRPFTDKQVALLQNFAAQAVIAMENARLLGELREALDQQTATTEVLQVINSSPGELEPVFEAILEKAMQACHASFGGLWIFDAGRYVAAALHKVPKAYADFLRTATVVPGPGSAPYRFLHGERSVIQNIDLVAEEPYRAGDPQRRALVDLGGARTAMQVPLCTDDAVIGVVTIYRQEVRAFDERQSALLQSFAAQAVIAIQNARLLSELRASLEQQTASAEILQVISESPTDVQPVLKAVVAAARRFCGAEDAAITLREGSEMVMAAHAGGQISSEPKETRTLLDRSTIRGRSIMDAATIQMPDVLALDPTEYGLAQHLARTLGFRAIVSTPMLRDDSAIGCITLRKADPVAFTQRQVELLETFAAQAVIAIENVRLFTELRQRTDDLTQSLEYQTATSDVLKVISRSTFDLQPVLDTLSATAARLCAAELTFMTRREGDAFRFVTAVGATPETTRDAIRLKQEVLDRHLFRPGRDTITGRVVAEGGVVQIVDVASDAEYALTDLTTVGKIKTLLGVPLMREGEVIGTMSLARQRIEPFTDKQIELIAYLCRSGSHRDGECPSVRGTDATANRNCASPSTTWATAWRCSTPSRGSLPGTATSRRLSACPRCFCRNGRPMPTISECSPSAANLARRTSKPNLPAVWKTPTAS